MIKYCSSIAKSDIVHSGSKSQVLHDLFNEKVGLGVIDEDYNEKHPLMNDFDLIDVAFNLQLLKNKNNEKFIIIIPNNLEVWWHNIARKNKIDLDKLGLLNRKSRFKKKYPKNEIHKLHRFFDLVKENIEMEKLLEWVSKYTSYQ
ncbi:MAG: hypothetical protein INQ03_22750 [Candidatus Heimdallarchaeota archaeon]|nr:hypothetical protein [Candidatus Heimdallarchaeota archaeon]